MKARSPDMEGVAVPIFLTILAIVAGILLLVFLLYVRYVSTGTAYQQNRIAAKMSWVTASLADNTEPNAEEVRRLAADPDVRKTLYRNLLMANRLDLFPPEYATRKAYAEGDLVYWLGHPNELKDPPATIELVEIVPLDAPPPVDSVEYYLFQFRTHSPHWASSKGWMAGVSGSYAVHGSPIPTSEPPGTFSELEPVDSKTPMEHVLYYHRRIVQSGRYAAFLQEAAGTRAV